jgi:hypothetical protein
MKSAIISALFFLVIFTACKKNGATITPAQAIEGNYTAYKYYSGIDQYLYSYPINGKTMTMQIDAIGNDSVRLQMRSVQNGFFSLGDTVIDRHLFVQKLPYGGYIVLVGEPVDSGSNENSISFDDTYNRLYQLYPYNGYYGYFIFAPPDYHKGGVQTIFKKIQ